MKTKAITGILLTLFLTSLAFTVMPASGHTYADPFNVDLIAGQNMVAGTVSVWNDGTYLYVRCITDDDWLMFEPRLAVGTSLDDIPQTQKGKPIPGQFSYPGPEGPTHWIRFEIPNEWGTGTLLYLAFHTVVFNIESCEEETAWADGYAFSSNDWAMYVEYYVQ